MALSLHLILIFKNAFNNNITLNKLSLEVIDTWKVGAQLEMPI